MTVVVSGLSGGLLDGIQKCLKVILTSFVAFIFFVWCCAIVVYQFISKTVYHANPVERQAHLNRSKKSFLVLLVTILCMVAPSCVRISTDNRSIGKGTFTVKDNQIFSRLKRRSIMISNHQIYTDWVFLWWLTYTSGLAGNVYIMLKKSLESIPVLGYGMKNYNFIFMHRKWEMDRVNLTNILQHIDFNARGIGNISKQLSKGVEDETETYDGPNKVSLKSDADQSKNGSGGSSSSDNQEDDRIGELDSSLCNDSSGSPSQWPYAVIVFPEGTNNSANTKARSDQYAAKIGKKPFENVLLPRTTGLRFVIEKLAPSLDCLYDVTVGYSGVSKGTFAEKLYSLKSVFLRGQSPELVSVYIRSFRLSEIPYNDQEQFENWIFNVWQDKDDLLNRYYEKGGTFDLDPDLNHTVTGLCQIDPLEALMILLVPFLLTLLTSVMLTKLICLYFGMQNPLIERVFT